MCIKPVLGVHPCGQCIECRLEYARTWAVRLMAEANGKECVFLTLTYAPEHLPADGSISKRAVQLFIKKLRKVCKLRYFASGEYGEKYKRPHYHMALIGISIDSPLFKNRKWNAKAKVYHCTMDAWPYGFCAVGNLTVDSANYVAGYMVKKVKGKHADEHYKSLGIEPEFALMSRKPGLGSEYLMQNYRFLRENGFMVFKGHKVRLPRYFFEKLFTKEEREQMKQLSDYANHYDWLKGRLKHETAEHRLQRGRNLKSKLSLKKRCLDD